MGTDVETDLTGGQVTMGCPSCMTNPAVFAVPILEKIK